MANKQLTIKVNGFVTIETTNEQLQNMITKGIHFDMICDDGEVVEVNMDHTIETITDID